MTAAGVALHKSRQADPLYRARPDAQPTNCPVMVPLLLPLPTGVGPPAWLAAGYAPASAGPSDGRPAVTAGAWQQPPEPGGDGCASQPEVPRAAVGTEPSPATRHEPRGAGRTLRPGDSDAGSNPGIGPCSNASVADRPASLGPAPHPALPALLTDSRALRIGLPLAAPAERLGCRIGNHHPGPAVVSPGCGRPMPPHPGVVHLTQPAASRWPVALGTDQPNIPHLCRHLQRLRCIPMRP